MAPQIPKNPKPTLFSLPACGVCTNRLHTHQRKFCAGDAKHVLVNTDRALVRSEQNRRNVRRFREARADEARAQSRRADLRRRLRSGDLLPLCVYSPAHAQLVPPETYWVLSAHGRGGFAVDPGIFTGFLQPLTADDSGFESVSPPLLVLFPFPPWNVVRCKLTPLPDKAGLRLTVDLGPVAQPLLWRIGFRYPSSMLVVDNLCSHAPRHARYGSYKTTPVPGMTRSEGPAFLLWYVGRNSCRRCAPPEVLEVSIQMLGKNLPDAGRPIGRVSDLVTLSSDKKTPTK